ncbi:hypothetical protein KOAAANKH_02573 [Brevundimonas sp. NIBR10]|uniref:hypothetical protein n=1 Tax=Brevundimonas sp. NIBR10 TaxID=3015997 RepID=UPI0022F19B3F|nr:hypothetical protein [Brevundimonas sp. NIBR10]WGM47691.1 hypothetical protein KOAAANKH_02573 [Brevundimonas sp. NIBR10]
MSDMTSAIIPKSDQINADDLIGGPRTIRITGVNISPGADQPVSIKFEGENGKVWRPCKSMSRVLVNGWGADANAYAGRSVTLYRDPSVKWGGMQVGGIRISHMSDIDRQMTMALTETKGKRAPFVVKPLTAETTRSEPEKPSTHPTATLDARADRLQIALNDAPDLAKLTSIWQSAGVLRADLAQNKPLRLEDLTRLWRARDTELDTTPPDDGFPGDQP